MGAAAAHDLRHAAADARCIAVDVDARCIAVDVDARCIAVDVRCIAVVCRMHQGCTAAAVQRSRPHVTVATPAVPVCFRRRAGGGGLPPCCCPFTCSRGPCNRCAAVAWGFVAVAWGFVVVASGLLRANASAKGGVIADCINVHVPFA